MHLPAFLRVAFTGGNNGWVLPAMTHVGAKELCEGTTQGRGVKESCSL
jgi:hypothetical protein